MRWVDALDQFGGGAREEKCPRSRLAIVKRNAAASEVDISPSTPHDFMQSRA
jgi:hypothetical protein